MFQVVASNKFLKDLKLLKKRSAFDFKLLQDFVNNLAIHGAKGIDQKHKPHKLKENIAVIGSVMLNRIYC